MEKIFKFLFYRYQKPIEYRISTFSVEIQDKIIKLLRVNVFEGDTLTIKDSINNFGIPEIVANSNNEYAATELLNLKIIFLPPNQLITVNGSELSHFKIFINLSHSLEMIIKKVSTTPKLVK